MVGQRKDFQGLKVLTTVVWVPIRLYFHFPYQRLTISSCFRFMEGKWLKATIVLASTLGSTYLALMQRSECVIKTEAHTINMDLNEQDY